MLLDYHIHLENGPLTLEWLKRFADVALERGISEIGISEHIFKFREAAGIWPSWWRLEPDRSLRDYVDLIGGARDLGLPVRIGIEAEYLDGLEREIGGFLRGVPWDYVIGSVHFIGRWGFDDPGLKEEWDRRNVDKAYMKYFALLNKAITCGLFDMIGHPDVIKVFGHRASGDLTGEYETIAASASSSGVVMEVSTAGLRKPVGEMYPHESFLAAFARRGVPITISSDAHFPEHVGHAFPDAAEYVRRAGYSSVVRFSQRKASQVPLG